MPNRIPMVNYLVLDDDDDAGHLEAQRCDECGAFYLDRRNACARCGGRVFAPTVLGTRGVVRGFTIVYRAPKDVATPFVSAIVDLDGGGRVRANLLIDADSAPQYMRATVELETFVAGVDSADNEAVAFGFRPVTEGSA